MPLLSNKTVTLNLCQVIEAAGGIVTRRSRLMIWLGTSFIFLQCSHRAWVEAFNNSECCCFLKSLIFRGAGNFLTIDQRTGTLKPSLIPPGIVFVCLCSGGLLGTKLDSFCFVFFPANIKGESFDL